MTKYTLMLGLTLFAFGCPGDKGDSVPGDDSNGGDDSADPCEGVDPTFNVTMSSSGVNLEITCGVGDYEFGMAETDATSSDPWTGEDCLDGYTTGDGTVYAFCHPADSTGVALTDVSSVNDIVEGSTTVMGGISEEVTTFIVYSLSTGSCWVWGDTPAYYASESCTEL